MRALLLIALLAPGLALAGPWPHWSPEYDPPAALATTIRAAEAVLQRAWPNVWWTLGEWLRDSMLRSGSLPEGDPSKPMHLPSHMRRGFEDPTARECYHYFATVETLQTLSYLHPTAAGRDALKRLAADAEKSIPDHCRGPRGDGARKLWRDEEMRFHDQLSVDSERRANVEAARMLDRVLGAGWADRAAQEASARVADNVLLAQPLLWAPLMLPESAVASSPILAPLLRAATAP